MNNTTPENWDFLTKISISVKQQLIGSNAIRAKSNQLNLSSSETVSLLDEIILEWLNVQKQDGRNYKEYAGYVFYHAVKNRFLNIQEIKK
ncbi:hypothetical protein [Polynucleobacter antarcticus]|uniref:Uncharacterized protein n=1 Tax=Polynucleobacter antarcticus TaxID=1743162 RepID=A0A6M9PII4_9BURK|nr:hypothetical protein [Polynucleobacter antarcticus]QKM62700.1 hypothetical protein DCO16_06300 [Polynucleobacter antarcticus]